MIMMQCAGSSDYKHNYRSTILNCQGVFITLTDWDNTSSKLLYSDHTFIYQGGGPYQPWYYSSNMAGANTELDHQIQIGHSFKWPYDCWVYEDIPF